MILEPKKIKSVTVSALSPSICHEVMGPDVMISVVWFFFNVEFFKPAFSLSSFTLVARTRVWSLRQLLAFTVALEAGSCVILACPCALSLLQVTCCCRYCISYLAPTLSSCMIWPGKGKPSAPLPSWCKASMSFQVLPSGYPSRRPGWKFTAGSLELTLTALERNPLHLHLEFELLAS